MPANIYLDIDGVLLNDLGATAFAGEFLSYVLTNYPDSTYWLTMRCRGDAEATMRSLTPYFDRNIIELLKKIKPTNWNIAKTEAIDFEKPFLWFDDACLSFEKAELEKRGVLANWIEIDLAKDLNKLKDLIEHFPAPVNVKGSHA